MSITSPAPGSLSPTRALLLGGLAVGTLDFIAATLVTVARGIPAIRVPQAIASGIYGRPAYSGGAGTVLLGVLLHFFIAYTVVAVFILASQRIPALTRNPLAVGALYGIGVWAVMSLVVVPLSNALLGPRTVSGVVIGLIVHILAIGIPTALFGVAAGGQVGSRDDPGRVRGPVVGAIR
jgi:hypothetical protein